MDTHTSCSQQLLSLLQLTSAALPVGAYSYSEGLETLIEQGVIRDPPSLQSWIADELRWGSIRVEAGIMLQTYRCFRQGDKSGLVALNHQSSAVRETRELREQSWQMGRSLLKLLVDLQRSLAWVKETIPTPYNYAPIFGIAAAAWQIDSRAAVLGYLHSWAANLITAGVKLIPLGQTVGQQLLFELSTPIKRAQDTIFDSLERSNRCCSWGLALASMSHETQYSRLFRS